MLTSDDLEILSDLAVVEPETLSYALKDVRRFCERDITGLEVPPDRRRTAWDRLGRYGVWLACDLIRQGITGHAELANALLSSSGVDDLRRLTVSHYGNRAYLIKLGRLLPELEHAGFRERQLALGSSLEPAVRRAEAEIERFTLHEPGFDELRLLRQYYEGNLPLSDVEARGLLRVTGEFGMSEAARLGQAETSGRAELLAAAEARLAYWQVRSNDLFGTDKHRNEAARVMSLAYARLIGRVLQ